MILNVFNQAFQLGAGILAAFVVSFLITTVLVKISRKLVFFLPTVLFLFSAIFWILGLLASDWAAFGLLLYGSLGVLAFIGSLVSSIIIYKKTKRN